MKKLIIFGTVIVLCLGCRNEEKEGDGAVWILAGAGFPDCGPGNTIVFTRGDIFYCDEYGRNVKRVTNTRDTHEQNPCWSPDGEHIAYHGYDPAKRSGGIFVIPKAGGEPTQLTTDDGDRPAWSPDGSTIVYNDSSHYDIWAVGAGEAAIERVRYHRVVVDRQDQRPGAGDEGRRRRIRVVGVEKVVRAAPRPQLSYGARVGQAVAVSLDEVDVDR